MSPTPITSNSVTPDNKRSVWMRGLFMLLMGFAYHLSGTLLAIITIFQFVAALLAGSPNAQLLSFGRGLGRYVQQIVCFLTFSSEDVPFPFSDWPSGE